MKANFLKKQKTDSERIFYHFSSYTFLKCFPLSFFAALTVYFLSALFIMLPAKETFKAILYPISFIAVGVSSLELVCHILITKNLSSHLVYWKLHKMSVSDNTNLLRKIQSYPLKKGFETFICFLICAVLMILYLVNSLNIDRKITAAFFVFIFELSYLYGMMILDITNKDCASLASEIVKSGVSVNDSSLNYKIYNIFSFIMYIVIPTIIGLILFIMTANLSWKPTIIHANGMIACRTLSELEQKNIFIKAIPTKSICIFRVSFVAVLHTLLITSLAFIYFGTTIRYNKKLQKMLEEIKEKSGEVKPLNLPVNKYREFSYTMYLLDKATYVFNNYTQKNKSTKKAINENLSSLLKSTEESTSYAENLKNEILPYFEKMQSLKNEPESC